MFANGLNNEEKASGIEPKILETVTLDLLKLQEKHSSELKELIDNNKKLLAIIGHDLKSPLASIISFLNLLKENMHQYDRTKIEEFVNVALISAKKSFSLLENLLQWAFTGNTVKSFQKVNIDLFILLNEELELIKLIASEKHIKIKVKNSLHLAVHVDINMIKTVFRNLLNNALKYTNFNGEIFVDVKKSDKTVQISIKDNGVGMETKVKDRIFTSESYVSAIGTDNEAGTGFGLLLCKEFIEIHGGKIWLISEYGKGSEFIFTLPINKNENVQ